MTDIGAYRVVDKLGEGGMGSVYICEHALLGRRAAIKMLLPSLSANEEIVQRFFNEARAVTRIHDPGIVQIFDFGFHVDGSAFIVMELLDGEPMDRRLARIGQFGIVEGLRLARLICTSLSAAHGHGIVHRDLKPENLFLVGDPAVTGGERPKILDFGVAKLSGPDSVFKTQTGMLLGTPVYMSPEQCRGAGDVDHRADIYSMGCVMFAMISGRPPFWREGSGELIAAHMLEPAPRLSSLMSVPPGIDELVDRCLAKDPAARFQSMEELARALGRVEEAVIRSSTDTLALAAPSASWLGQVSPLPLPMGQRLPLPAPQATPWLSPTPTTMSRTAGELTPVPEARRRGPIALAIAITAAITAIAVVAVIALRNREMKSDFVSGQTRSKSDFISVPQAASDAGILVPLADAAPDAAPDAAVVAPPDAAIAAPPRPPPKRPPPHPGATHDNTTTEPDIDRGD